RANSRRGRGAAGSRIGVNLTPLVIVALVASALLGVVGTWSDALGSFPWWRIAVASLVVGLALAFVMARGLRVDARWRAAARLFLGRAETRELELRGEARGRVSLLALPVLPLGRASAEASAPERGSRDAGAGSPHVLEPIEL